MWHLDDKEPIYVQIYEQIKKMILEKKYVENQKLPSKRGLADSLKVSPMTVDVAYQQLLTEGYIYSKPKSGYYVEANLAYFKTIPTNYTNSNIQNQLRPCNMRLRPMSWIRLCFLIQLGQNSQKRCC